MVKQLNVMTFIEGVARREKNRRSSTLQNVSRKGIRKRRHYGKDLQLYSSKWQLKEEPILLEKYYY